MNIEELKVGLIIDSWDDEVSALLEAFESIEPVPLEILAEEQLSRFDVLWCHTIEPIPEQMKGSQIREKLTAYVEAGGGLLVSLLACSYLNDLGLESTPLDESVADGEWEAHPFSDWKWDFLNKAGFQAFLRHPIFTGLGSGAFTWDAEPGSPYWRAGFKEQRPTEGEIVAVRRRFIAIDTGYPEIVEYRLGSGSVLAVSAFLYFTDQENLYRPNLLRFSENLLAYLAGRFDPGDRHWRKALNKTAYQQVDAQPLPVKFGAFTGSQKSDLTLDGESSENFFDVAGRRCLLMGRETGRIEEVWSYPIRLVKDFQIAFHHENRSYPVEKSTRHFEIRPEAAVIDHELDDVRVRQLCFTALDRPGACLVLELDGNTNGAKPVEVDCSFRSDLRLMWPYPENALGDLGYAWNEEAHAFLVQDKRDEFAAIVGSNLPPSQAKFSRQDNRFSFRVSLTPETPAVIVVAGSSTGVDEAQETYQALMEDPDRFYQEIVSHYKRLSTEQLSIETPDETFNQGFAWAKVATEKFFATTPGIGSGFMAGYRLTGKNEFMSGRPGYAWYFGRDSEWCSFAVDGYGEFEQVRDNLRLLMDLQDLSGKIPHEASTSGVTYYDSADSSPLFVILMEHYLRSSGDDAFIREHWDAIQRAIDFAYTTDRDGDGLMDNTGGGHGWVEAGALAPPHTSIYLTGIWAEALRCAARLAEVVGEASLAKRYSRDHERVREILNREFWNPKREFFHFAKNRDGNFNPEPSIMPSVPMVFGLLDEEKSVKTLIPIASHEFTADWGARIVAESSEIFDGGSYHEGSVWPLFTGWASLAEYRYHRPLQGYVHLMNNLLLYRHWTKGHRHEVLHGVRYEPAGVCPHQAWSETMALQPAIEGLLGFRPDVPNHRLELSPHLPAGWEDVRVRNFPFGEERIDLTIDASLEMCRFSFRKSNEKPVQVMFSPGWLGLRNVESVRIDDTEVDYELIETLSDRHVAVVFELHNEATVQVTYDLEPQVVPPVPDPKPGDRSRGLRILDLEYPEPGIGKLQVEAPGGMEHTLEVLSKREISPMENLSVERMDDSRYRMVIGFDGTPDRYVRREITLTAH
ncbi:MAG: amylo-alpha-1,6-glucosidase [Candidatus Bipolaricaulia bacterium]